MPKLQFGQWGRELKVVGHARDKRSTESLDLQLVWSGELSGAGCWTAEGWPLRERCLCGASVKIGKGKSLGK
jgi:hypothetical protein